MGGKPQALMPTTQHQDPNLGLQNINASQIAASDPGLSGLLNQLSSGGIGYQDAIKQASGMNSSSDPYSGQRSQAQSDVDALRGRISQQFNTSNGQSYEGNPQYQQTINDLNQAQNRLNNVPSAQSAQEQFGNAAVQRLFSDPRTASLIASGQVLDQDPRGSAFRGLSGNLASDREALLGRDSSYGLTDQDLQAYGQASNEAARQSAASGNNLAQMLASRGLGSSGNAGAQLYSGILGNQNEKLAASQLQIAQSRVNTAQQLAQARMNSDISLGAQYQNALGQQEGLNTGLSQDDFNKHLAANNANLANSGFQQNLANEGVSGYNQASQGSGGSTAGTLVGGTLGAIGGGLAAGPQGALTGAGIGSSVGSRI